MPCFSTLSGLFLQVLAKLRAELTYSVFESVDAAENDVINPQRDSLLATGEHPC